ncbi:Crinkler (CRN) family protein [Phytophthora palmivora]|uniref:Crinkler (CRN) family protein n=1 Tax=Phytophthora palmivora TaxID=4796 RepID=A0A2P4YT64_9STRA|nr:Crinkler (CRN) family protein [Phytophthora palmivora]
MANVQLFSLVHLSDVPVPEVFCLPLWTNDELATIVHLYPGATSVWEDRMKCLGDIPRLVLQDIQTDPKSLLMSACNYCSLDDTISMVSVDSPVSQSVKHVQRLIQMQSEEPYREDKKKVVLPQVRILLQCLLGSCYGNSLAQSLCNYILEPYVLDLLEQGGTFICRELESGRKRKWKASNGKQTDNGDDEGMIFIPVLVKPRQTVDLVRSDQYSNQLYVPRTFE